MESNVVITDDSHNKIYQTYNELKKKLPANYLKMKVLHTPKYFIKKTPILKDIENNKNNSNKTKEKQIHFNKFINKFKNIYILSDETIKLKNQKMIKKYNNEQQKYDDLFKKTLLTEKEKYKQNNNSNNSGIDEQFENFDYKRYYFHSSPIKDSQIKSNIYLPKIIDRMKYSIPRSERDKNGFHIEGIGIFSNNNVKYDKLKDKYEVNFNNNNNEIS